MNTLALENRVKRIEEKVETTRGKIIAFSWRKAWESDEDAVERWKRENPGSEDYDLIIITVKWSDKDPELPFGSREPATEKKEPVSADTEIEEILIDLQGQGFTMEEIARMMEEPESVRERVHAQEPNEVWHTRTPDEPVKEEDEKATHILSIPGAPDPMRSDELVSMFRGRR
jgi:hypothetical protein